MPGSSDPTKRFSDRVENYVRHRPGYPAEVIDILRIEAGLTASDTVADIGSGTGILSELFLRAGHDVFGVEPNAEMRSAAEKLLIAYPRFRSIAGSAEATTLPKRSVDLVVAGQAFHWFDRKKAQDEFKRILQDKARVALLWNDRKTSGTRFSEGYEELLRVFGTDYAAVNHKNLGREAFDRFFGSGGWTSISLPNEQRLDLEGLRGRLLSSSYAPAPGQPRYEEMMKDLERIFAGTQERGFVRMEYESKIYFGRLRPGS
jgi:SAM-dependent methyltransferase